ncbi:hypothetical protein D210916BOD24_11070 [Alteromonas sp. D210916BOD_24]|uniref:hypothetical protein n=1 Tax=Alteromonas sp. D210916BOD_24 TaxID=3157618 RepID=UPI00399C57E8
MSKSISPLLSYDRFGWYWQPKSWLENMSPTDARKATENTTGIDQQGKALLAQAILREKKEMQAAQAMQFMLDALRK